MVLGRAPASQLAEKLALPLFLGGAAVYRCGNCFALNSALAAEGTASPPAEKPTLPLLLGGAAVYRCGYCLVLNSALAAEGTALDQELLFPQPVQPCRRDPPKIRALAPEGVRENWFWAIRWDEELENPAPEGEPT
jgi:hypothetical protein